MQSTYRLGRPPRVKFRRKDRDKAFETIRKIPKPVIVFKILAAGQNKVQEAFEYAFARLAPKDGVCVGVFTKDDRGQLRQNCRLTVSLSRTPTRSAQ